jgi:phosphoribosylglycinamide formyltransferase 1
MTNPLQERALAHDAREPMRLAAFVSGGGSNLQVLLDRFNADPFAPARVAVVIASRAGIRALERADAARVPSHVLDPRELTPEDLELRTLNVLDTYAVELVVLAGYLHLVPPTLVRRYRGRMLNIHPALLPSFGGSGLYGSRVHRAVIDSGACVSGVTIHLVDERYDSGPIVAQWPVPRLAGDTPESLAERVLAVEHRLLPTVIEAFAGVAQPSAGPPEAVAFALQAALPDELAMSALIRLPAPGQDQ